MKKNFQIIALSFDRNKLDRVFIFPIRIGLGYEHIFIFTFCSINELKKLRDEIFKIKVL